MVNKQISNLFQAQSQVIASYEYTDIATNTGYLTFYLIKPTGGNLLSQSANITGYNMYLENDSTTSTFQVQIKKPLVVEGDCFVQLALDTSSNSTISCSLVKNSGGTETTIGTSGNQNVNSTNKAKYAWRISCTKTYFKRNDYLYFKVTSNQNNTYILCDPTDSEVTTPNGAQSSTQSKILVPVRIEL